MTSKGIHDYKVIEGVVIPKMAYTIDIWGISLLKRGRGKKDNRWGAQGFVKKMELV